MHVTGHLWQKRWVTHFTRYLWQKGGNACHKAFLAEEGVRRYLWQKWGGVSYKVDLALSLWVSQGRGVRAQARRKRPGAEA